MAGEVTGRKIRLHVADREKHTRGSGGSLEPHGPLPMHLHTAYKEYFECLPTLLNPLAERACFSQVGECEATTHERCSETTIPMLGGSDCKTSDGCLS